MVGWYTQANVANSLPAVRRLVPAEGVNITKHTEPDHDFDVGNGFVGGPHGVCIGPDVQGNIADGIHLGEDGRVKCNPGIVAAQPPFHVEAEGRDILELEG